MQPPPDGVTFNVNPGPSPTLTLSEETELVRHCTYMASIGYGYSRNEFLNLATDLAVSLKRKTVNPPFAQSWYDGFKKRHPEIILAKPQKLSMIRAKSTSEEVLDKYFRALEIVMGANDLLGKPENIWNVDETGLQMEHSPPNVMYMKGTTPQAITSNRGQKVTIIAAGSAAGNRIPPFYVFPGKRWNDGLLDGASPGSAGTMSETGWSNSLVFQEYLERHFLKNAPNNGSPILLLCDGHKSHVNLTLKEWGEDHNVLFFVIPPHTSHVTQPLDVGCFGPLKRVYHSECQRFMRNMPGVHISRLNVAKTSSTAYNKGMTPDNLISSFRKSGIFPRQRNQIDPIKTVPSTIYEKEEPENGTNEHETSEKNETENGAHGMSFLDQRKITKVAENPKKRKSEPSVKGNLMSPSKQTLLKRPVLKKLSTKQEKTKSTKKSVNSAKKIKPNPQTVASPKPGTSGLNSRPEMSGIPVDDSDTDSTIDEDVDESNLCCMCKKLTPNAFNNVYTVEIVTWGQCDSCDRWVHLKYCSPVRVLRRGASFLCPLCDREC